MGSLLGVVLGIRVITGSLVVLDSSGITEVSLSSPKLTSLHRSPWQHVF